MRPLQVGLTLLLVGCWSEPEFRRLCERAGHCEPAPGSESDAGPVDGGELDAGTHDQVDAGLDAGTERGDAGLDAGRDGGADAGLDAGDLDGGRALFDAVMGELFPSGLRSDGGVWFEVIRVGSTNERSLGGVLTPAGSVVCIPANETSYLEYFADGGVERRPALASGFRPAWQGGVLRNDGTILAIPYVDPRLVSLSGGTWSELGITVAESGPLFQGGVTTLSGHSLLVPHRSGVVGVLRSSGAWSTRPIDAGLPTSFAEAFGGAVLLPDGERAFAVPLDTGWLWEVSLTADRPVAEVRGHGGGVILPSGAEVLLLPTRTAFFDRVGLDGGVVRGPSSFGYFSGAWSTNGFGYALQTINGWGRYARFDRLGSVSEVALPPQAFAPDGSVVDGGFVGNESHIGLVGMPDGRLVACPYESTALLVLHPEGARTVPSWVMTSPWLDKL